MISVSIDPRKVNAKLAKLQQGLSRNQVASTMNASLKSGRAYSSRLARSVANLKPKRIYENVNANTRGDLIHLYKARLPGIEGVNFRSSDSDSIGKLDLHGSLYFTNQELNIADYGAKPAQKGGIVMIWKGLGRQTYPSAWQKKFDPGKWFQRIGKERIPYEGVRGPSMADIMRPATGMIMAFVTRRMEMEYLRKIRGLLARG